MGGGRRDINIILLSPNSLRSLGAKHGHVPSGDSEGEGRLQEAWMVI